MSKGFWSTDFVNLFLDFLLSEILVARPRVIRVENKVLSPLSSYQTLLTVAKDRMFVNRESNLFARDLHNYEIYTPGYTQNNWADLQQNWCLL